MRTPWASYLAQCSPLLSSVLRAFLEAVFLFQRRRIANASSFLLVDIRRSISRCQYPTAESPAQSAVYCERWRSTMLSPTEGKAALSQPGCAARAGVSFETSFFFCAAPERKGGQKP